MKSFYYAFRGIFETIKSERNMRIHLCVAIDVILAGILTHISAIEWAAVLICIGLVTALECLNTAIEKLCDTVHPEKAEGIRIAKDASAGAVLCAAIASAAVGGMIFFRADKLNAVLELLKYKKAVFFALVIMLFLEIKLIIGRKREDHELR